MKEKPDVLQGTLALMVLSTLDALGLQHGYATANPPLKSVMPPGSMLPSSRKATHEAVEEEHVRGIRVIDRRVEPINLDIVALNQGTLYPLLKLEHEGCIVSRWGTAENNRHAETRDGHQTAAIIALFFKVKAEDLP